MSPWMFAFLINEDIAVVDKKLAACRDLSQHFRGLSDEMKKVPEAGLALGLKTILSLVDVLDSPRPTAIPARQ